MNSLFAFSKSHIVQAEVLFSLFSVAHDCEFKETIASPYSVSEVNSLYSFSV